MKQFDCSCARLADIDRLAVATLPFDTESLVQHFGVCFEQPTKGCLSTVVRQFKKSGGKDPMP